MIDDAPGSVAKLVSPSMYTVPKSSPPEAPEAPPVTQSSRKEETAPKCCRWCGAVMLNPRRNQKCCSAVCREAYERQKRQQSRQNAVEKPKCKCLWCGGDFDQVRKAQEFCCPEHQQAFNNFWKGKGPALAKALHAWRVGKEPGGLTKVCREFSAAREELQDKQAKAKRTTTGRK
ncbi:conserved protein of unknown function [Magnetospirillum gryphiswaldense MSR-1 v2]|uniref:Uncharacterized protein n=1 Tax=Magnetospirillum gryphiswaldense (strain DSM 6361 / JCM 21280 / NBRC 15271 / MSR-1) TaxID=431944 RepID=V6F5W2_MAGGM|nr:hypothetical protein [Magnetospirillum gryphiswaldense]CDK99878.1 conserved protein of unknown function [Magnetospirillum gryphiswaldense MSR-1 v2]